ncbi:hypothetical protein D3C76_1437100 [compost metagenome]
MEPLKFIRNMPAVSGRLSRLVNAPPSVPVFCLVVTTLVFVLPSNVFTGTGVLPTVTVPPEYTTSVAAAVVPPDMLDIRKVLPLPAALRICRSRFWVEGIAALLVVKAKKLPAEAAPLSAEASIPGAENVLVSWVNRGPLDWLNTL